MAVLGLLAVSCYDDSELRSELEDHETRISRLEDICEVMNTNIAALQAIIDATESGDYITEVSPIMDDGEEVGYVITFNDAGKIKIYHGTDGQDGAPGKDGQDGKDGVDTGETPDISIRLDEDGVYYWTLNGEWLLDDNGNKVKAVGTDGKDGKDGQDGADGKDGAAGEDGTDGTNGSNGTDGKDGKDGVTPQLKIEEEYWYVSYDGGKNWTKLGKATGEDGKDGSAGGDSIFSEVYQSGGYVYFILSGGDSFKVPTSASSALDIEFDVEQGVAVVPETTLKFKYTIKGAVGKTLVKALLVADAFDDCIAVKPIDDTYGYVYFYNDIGLTSSERDESCWLDEKGEVTWGNFYESKMIIIVIVTDSNDNQIIKALNFTQGVLESVNDAYIADHVAGTISVAANTNLSLDTVYEVRIPENAQSWLSYAPTKATMRTDNLEFTLKANESDKFRSSVVEVVNEKGYVFDTFHIFQRSTIAGEIMTFADERVRNACVARFDKDLDGELTYEEAATVTDLKDLFLEKDIVTFDELEYFTSVTEIPDGLFKDCASLESVRLSECVKTIGNEAFLNCSSLKRIILPSSLEKIGREAFAGCAALSTVNVLAAYPPQGASRMFEDSVTIYVIPVSVGFYKTDYYWCDYTILPDGFNLKLDLTKGDMLFTYNREIDETFVCVPVSLKISGDLSNVDKVDEFGFYVNNNYDEMYYPIESLNLTVTDTLKFDDRDLEFTCEVGAYLRYDDGTIITFDTRTVDMVYDQVPSVEILEVTYLGLYRDDSSRLLYQIVLNVSGAPLFEDLNISSIGDKDIYIRWLEFQLYDGIVKGEFVLETSGNNQWPISIAITYSGEDFEEKQSNIVTLNN